MTDRPGDELEELLAQALAAHDAGGEPALATFLAAHEDRRAALERGLQRCRQMGLLARTGDAPDFPDRLGDFRLRRRLGSGGMGVVYEAVQESLGRKVALKVIRPELVYFDGARQRFAREIDAISKLDHPSIVPVLAAGDQDGIPYFAMPLLQGASIDQVSDRLQGQRLDQLDGASLRRAIAECVPGTDETATATVFHGSYWQAAVRMLVQIGDGIAHAHAVGIIHRDLKPTNCMLMPDGRALVLDFGVARVRGAREITRPGAEPGSPTFMSPEQLRGVATDERTDVYSLALTLWQLLTRERPFAGDDPTARILRGDLPALARLRGLPGDLAIVVGKAIDIDRERRYATLPRLLDDLRAVLERRSIAGRRLPAWLRLRRLAERHRVATAVATTLAAAAIVVPIVLRTQQDAADRRVATAAAQAEQSLLAMLDTLEAAQRKLSAANLPDLPAIDPLEREVLDDAVRRYRELLPAHPGHERLRLQASIALRQRGQLHERLGELTAAIALFEEADVALGTLDETSSTPLFESRGYLALARSGLASRQGDTTALAAACAIAETSFAEVERRQPGSVASCKGRSEVAVMRAKLFPGAAEAEACEQQLRLGLELALSWASADPDDLDARLTVVRRHSGLGAHLRKRGKHGEAETHLQEAIERARQLPENDRLWPPPRMLLSVALESRANLAIDQRDVAAVQLLEECVQLREAVGQRFPDNVTFAVQLGAAHQNLARALLLAEEPERAEAAATRACAVQRAVLQAHPRHQEAARQLLQHLSVLTRCQAQTRQFDRLVETAAQLALANADASTQHQAAFALLTACALCRTDAPERAEQFWRQHGDRALSCLFAAAAAGWDPAWRLDHPLYEPLRTLPRFDELRTRIDSGRSDKNASGR